MVLKNLIKFHQESLALMYLWNIYGGKKRTAKCDNCMANVYHVNTNMHISVWIMTYEYSRGCTARCFLVLCKAFSSSMSSEYTDRRLSRLANYVTRFLSFKRQKEISEVARHNDEW